MDRADRLGKPIIAPRSRPLPTDAPQAGALAKARFARVSVAIAACLAFGIAQAGEKLLETLPGNIRDVTPAYMQKTPVPLDGLVERLPAALPAPPQPPPPQPVRWNGAQIVAAGILTSGGTEILLGGIEALVADAKCGEPGKDWPCGNFARAALARLVRGRPIECQPVANTLMTGHRIVTRCSVSGRDMGKWLVRQGWAVPLAGSGYEAALEEARRTQSGQWGQGMAAQ